MNNSVTKQAVTIIPFCKYQTESEERERVGDYQGHTVSSTGKVAALPLQTQAWLQTLSINKLTLQINTVDQLTVVFHSHFKNTFTAMGSF